VKRYSVVATVVFTMEDDAAKELSTADRSVMIPATLLGRTSSAASVKAFAMNSDARLFAARFHPNVAGRNSATTSMASPSDTHSMRTRTSPRKVSPRLTFPPDTCVTSIQP